MLKLFNTLSKKLEEFQPVEPDQVRIYACGPTVYDYMHIGNLRTATLMDIVKRSISYLGYQPKTVMNITDVDDKIENRAKESHSSVDELTKKFSDIYFAHLAEMNVSADEYPRASEHIKEQQELVTELIERGYAYEIPGDGIYFDINKDADYGKLGNTFKSDRAESRIGKVAGKRNDADFALWKLPAAGEDRQKLWDSPWGKGFPGWHIECSAMSMKHLSHAFDDGVFHPDAFQTIDLHLGGEDIRDVHHENEVAQSESATGKQFVKYWLHGAMLNVEAEKMSKSLSNFYTLEQVKEKGFEPLALRYLYLTSHYRKIQIFTWQALAGAQTAYLRLQAKVAELFQNIPQADALPPAPDNAYQQKFQAALESDFNIPEALAVAWDMLKSDLDDQIKLVTILDFDKVLGLKLESAAENPHHTITIDDIPAAAQKLIEQREEARMVGDWGKADAIRERLATEYGIKLKDAAKSQS